MGRKRMNHEEWTTPNYRGQLSEVWFGRKGEIVLLGIPERDDEDHNCDANGCGQSHVLWRGTITS